MNVHLNSLYPFKKNFKVFIIDNVPSFQKTVTNNFAYVLHEKNNDFCAGNSTHYHVLTEISKLPNDVKKVKDYSVPCLYSCFNSLIFFTNMVISGAIMDKLVLAVEYNSKYQSGGYSVSRKKSHSFCSMNKDAQTLTDFIPDCTLDRFLRLYNCVKFAELSKIMKLIITVYGSLHNNTDMNEVCFL